MDQRKTTMGRVFGVPAAPRPLMALMIALLARSPIAEESAGAPREPARDCTELFEAIAAKESVELVTIGRIDPRSPVALVDGEPLTLRLDGAGKEVIFAAADGSITVHDVASGDRRRAVTPGRKRQGEPMAFLVDSYLRRIALADGREIQVLEYPELARVADFRMVPGLELSSRSGDFFGRGALAVIGVTALRVADSSGMSLSKIDGELVGLCGHPVDEVVFAWLAASNSAAEWRLMRFKQFGKQMKEDAIGAPIAAPGAGWVAMWSGDARAGLLLEGPVARVFATRELAQIAEGTLALEDGARVAGLTPRGEFLVVLAADGEIRIHRVVDGFPAIGALRPGLSRGIKRDGYQPERLRYHARGDRFVAVSETGDSIFVLGPPGARAP